MSQAIPELELARLSALFRYGVLDTEPEPAFDVVLEAVRQALDVPFAQIAFADTHRFWAKASIGSIERETPRFGSLTEPLLTGPPALVVPDTLVDPVLKTAIPVCCPPHVRAFAGVRLRGAEEDVLGVLFGADVQPRPFSPSGLAVLEDAGHQIGILLESRRRQRLDPAESGALACDPFTEQVGRMIAVARSGGQPLGLLFIDLEPLRSRLEALQPGLGRILMRRIVDLGRDKVRRRDSVGALGGNRFGVLLADTDAAGAGVAAGRLSEKLGEGWSILMAGQGTGLVPVGIAIAEPGFPETPASLLATAEQACRTRPSAVPLAVMVA